jgi:hypothetical protein
MDRRTFLPLVALLSVTAAVAAIAACAESPAPTDLALANEPTEPEDSGVTTTPIPTTPPPAKKDDAGSKDSGKESAAPPPPPPPDGKDGEMCDTSDPVYQQRLSQAKTGDCPCLAGECCAEMRIGNPPFQLVLASGCVEK